MLDRLRMLQPYGVSLGGTNTGWNQYWVEPILGNGMHRGDFILLEEKQGSIERTRGINEFEYK